VTRDVLSTIAHEDWHVRLDLAPQRLSLAIPEEWSWQREEELTPTNGRLARGFVSASMLALEAKLFDDGLYAAVETETQDGKAKLLKALASASPTVAAAATLGGENVSVSADARQIMTAFLADPLASKPLGFYTWSDALRRAFQRDRLLQRQLQPAEAVALHAELEADAALKAAYGAFLDLAAQITNGFVEDQPDLRRPNGRHFFPPSRSYESDLVRRLYGDRPIPDGFSLADEFVKRIRDGSVTIAPTKASGWYDYQTWAIEPLAAFDRADESARVRINARYREQLEDLFKAIVALTRESHVKQLESPTVGAAIRGLGDRNRRPVAYIRPELTVEPLRTYYERRAEAYVFVRRVLESMTPLKSMRRVTSAGAVARPLDVELDEMIGLFRAAAAIAGRELGIAAANEDDCRVLREWAKGADARSDVRMMVPVFYDIGRRRTKVWAVLGWATRRLNATFDAVPRVTVVRGDPVVEFTTSSMTLAYPVFAETYVSRLLDRDEFRTHCDRYKTADRILAALD